VNSRFVKNNIGLLGVIGVCALLALIGLVFVVMYAMQMNDNIQNVKDVSEKIRKINTQRPAPVAGNMQPISDDIAVYEKAVNELNTYFGHPLEPATARFFEVLTLRKAMWLPDGIDENGDEVVQRMVALNQGEPRSSMSNADFDRYLDLISAEALAKRVKEALSDEDKAKQLSELIPNADKLGEDALANIIYSSAELRKKIQSSVTVADLAKRIKALPAGGIAAGNVETSLPGAGKLDEAALANRLAALTELDKRLAEAGSAADLARQIKDELADEAKAKRIKELFPDADKLGENDLAKKIEAVGGLVQKLQAQLSAADLAKNFKTLAENDAVVVKVLVPDADKLDEALLTNRIVDAAQLEKKLRALFPDSDPETLKRLREIPDKLTAEEFLDAFNKTMEGTDERDFVGRGTRFDEFILYKVENWDEAQRAFIAAAGQPADPKKMPENPCIVERLDRSNVNDVMLSTLGVARRFGGDPKNLQQMKDNIIRQLEGYQVRLFDRARGLGIVRISDGAGNDVVQDNDDQSLKNLKTDDYPDIANHMDIVSYMLYRVGGANVSIYDVQIRLKSGDSSEGGMDGGRNFSDSKEQRDGFDVYHYTLEISGTMEQIRNAVKLLDDCYAVRRVYLVKNIALYAEDNIADGIFVDRRMEKRPAAARKTVANDVSEGRRGRRGSRAVAETAENNNDVDAEQKRQKMIEEYEKRQKQLDPEKRDGYGEPITAAKGANETFRAVIDVEYVVKPRK